MDACQLFDVLFEADDVEQAAPSLQVVKQIQVAGRACVASGARPEQVEVQQAMSPAQSLDRLAVADNEVVLEAPLDGWGLSSIQKGFDDFVVGLAGVRFQFRQAVAELRRDLD